MSLAAVECRRTVSTRLTAEQAAYSSTWEKRKKSDDKKTIPQRSSWLAQMFDVPQRQHAEIEQAERKAKKTASQEASRKDRRLADLLNENASLLEAQLGGARRVESLVRSNNTWVLKSTQLEAQLNSTKLQLRDYEAACRDLRAQVKAARQHGWGLEIEAACLASRVEGYVCKQVDDARTEAELRRQLHAAESMCQVLRGMVARLESQHRHDMADTRAALHSSQTQCCAQASHLATLTATLNHTTAAMATLQAACDDKTAALAASQATCDVTAAELATSQASRLDLATHLMVKCDELRDESDALAASEASRTATSEELAGVMSRYLDLEHALTASEQARQDQDKALASVLSRYLNQERVLVACEQARRDQDKALAAYQARHTTLSKDLATLQARHLTQSKDLQYYQTSCGDVAAELRAVRARHAAQEQARLAGCRAQEAVGKLGRATRGEGVDDEEVVALRARCRALEEEAAGCRAREAGCQARCQALEEEVAVMRAAACPEDTPTKASSMAPSPFSPRGLMMINVLQEDFVVLPKETVIEVKEETVVEEEAVVEETVIVEEAAMEVVVPASCPLTTSSPSSSSPSSSGGGADIKSNNDNNHKDQQVTRGLLNKVAGLFQRAAGRRLSSAPAWSPATVFGTCRVSSAPASSPATEMKTFQQLVCTHQARSSSSLSSPRATLDNLTCGSSSPSAGGSSSSSSGGSSSGGSSDGGADLLCLAILSSSLSSSSSYC